MQTPNIKERWEIFSEFVTFYRAHFVCAGASRAHRVRLRQGRRGRHAPVAAARLVGQALYALFLKPLHPLVDEATADPDRGGNIGDRHPISYE
jgi:hypothetical protein